MPSTLTEVVTRSSTLREKNKYQKNKITTIITTLIVAIINILIMLIGTIINILGAIHNKHVINIILLTTIGITMFIKIIKPIIRIEHQKIIEDNVGIKLINNNNDRNHPNNNNNNSHQRGKRTN